MSDREPLPERPVSSPAPSGVTGEPSEFREVLLKRAREGVEQALMDLETVETNDKTEYDYLPSKGQPRAIHKTRDGVAPESGRWKTPRECCSHARAFLKQTMDSLDSLAESLPERSDGPDVSPPSAGSGLEESGDEPQAQTKEKDMPVMDTVPLNDYKALHDTVVELLELENQSEQVAPPEVINKIHDRRREVIRRLYGLAPPPENEPDNG